MVADCALITALPKELNALLSHFRYFKSRRDESGISFYETTTPTGISLVGAVGLGMGQLNAAILSSKVIQLFNPKKLILVGISGGLDYQIPLGDVIVSEQIVDYEIGKITSKGFSPRWSVYPCDAGLLNGVNNIRSDHWQRYITTSCPIGENKPGFHVGTYLSGNKVIANEKMAGALKAIWSRASAIEMESAGIAAVLRQISNPPGFVTVKSICDYADSKKNDDWQAYAADTAASFAYSLVCESLTPEDIRPIAKKNEPSIRINNIDFRALRLILADVYDMTELKMLCRDLNVDWDEIPGNRKSERISELIEYLKRRERLDEMIRLVNEERNNILKAYLPS